MGSVCCKSESHTIYRCIHVTHVLMYIHVHVHVTNVSMYNNVTDVSMYMR